MIYFYVSLMTYICFCLIKYREGLFYLKKNRYNSKKFLEYVNGNLKGIFLNFEILSIPLIAILFLVREINIMSMIIVVFYTAMFLYKLKTNNKDIKRDKKLDRRIVVIMLIYLILNICFCLDYDRIKISKSLAENYNIYYTILILTGYVSYYIVYLANLIASRFDKK